jgi:hypothetical protein
MPLPVSKSSLDIKLNEVQGLNEYLPEVSSSKGTSTEVPQN